MALQNHLKKRFFLVGAALVFFSCTDSAPELQDARLSSIFDFENPYENPVMYISVFISPSSNIDLASEIKLTEEESGFTWNITSPLIFSKGALPWVGNARLASYQKKPFSLGTYRLEYVDLAERSVETKQVLFYPQALLTSDSSAVTRILGVSAAVYTAVYNAQEVLIFFEKQREEWKNNDERIKSDFPASASYRDCIVSSDNRVICLMPIVQLVVPPLKIEDNEIVE